MDRQSLAIQLVCVARLTGNFTLRSGQSSQVYWDKFQIESRPLLLDAVASHLVPLLGSDYSMVAGVELGGIPLVTILSHKSGKRCLFIRKEAKKHGGNKQIEGDCIHGSKVVLVEDIVTTASQAIKAVEVLRESGLSVEQVVCVIDRQGGGEQNLAKIGCELRALFTARELEGYLGA